VNPSGATKYEHDAVDDGLLKWSTMDGTTCLHWHGHCGRTQYLHLHRSLAREARCSIRFPGQRDLI
ncbi:hypothetical protein BX616_007519, partial [Lobosporangium transversale]